MGKGKGAPEGFVAPVTPGRIIRCVYETGALVDNIAKYERAFGPIRISEESPMPPLSVVKGEA